MLRLKRLAASDAAPTWTELGAALEQVRSSLHLSPQAQSLVASWERDGDYLNFGTELSGTLKDVPCPHGAPFFVKGQEVAALNFAQRQQQWLAALQPQLPPVPQPQQQIRTTRMMSQRQELFSKHMKRSPHFAVSESFYAVGAKMEAWPLKFHFQATIPDER